MANTMLEDRHDGGVYRWVEVIYPVVGAGTIGREKERRGLSQRAWTVMNISEIALRNGMSRGLLSV
jgi:hypothetical protein